MAQVRLLTAEDIEHWHDDVELYEGVPRSVAATPDVSAIALYIGHRLSVVVVPIGQGIVFGADASFRLARNPDTVYLPDAAFVRADRIRDRSTLDFPFEGAPDLAVEVRSPSDRLSRVQRKMDRYLAGGVGLAWLVDPVTRTVAVYLPGVAPVVRQSGDSLDGRPVLDGLVLAVDDVFTVGGMLP